MKTKKTFEAIGIVYGVYWGGGEGAYPARKVTANTRKELVKKINDGIKDGSLDSGMGYQRLLGAFMDITTITYIDVDGKTFSNSESESEFFGDLDSEQEDFLLEVLPL